MKVNFEINIDGKDSDDLLIISTERVDEINKIITNKLYDIAANKDNFSFERQTLDGIKQGMHKGKILAKLLDGVTAEQEVGFIISMFHIYIKHIIEINKLIAFSDAIKSAPNV